VASGFRFAGEGKSDLILFLHRLPHRICHLHHKIFLELLIYLFFGGVLGSSCKYENKRFLLFLYKPPGGVAASSFVVSFCFVLLGFVLFFSLALDADDADDDDAVAIKYHSTSQEEDTQSVDNSQFRRARPREKQSHTHSHGCAWISPGRELEIDDELQNMHGLKGGRRCCGFCSGVKNLASLQFGLVGRS
jgi:hypothetical protein